MLSLRFSLLMIIIFFFIVLLLSNGNLVDVNLIIFQNKSQLSIIIFIAALFGSLMTVYVSSIVKKIKKIKIKD